MRVQELMGRLLESRARRNTLDADIHLMILRTHDCIAESQELLARLDAELAKLNGS